MNKKCNAIQNIIIYSMNKINNKLFYNKLFKIVKKDHQKNNWDQEKMIFLINIFL